MDRQGGDGRETDEENVSCCQEKDEERRRDQKKSRVKEKIAGRERKTERGNMLIVVYFHIRQMF